MTVSKTTLIGALVLAAAIGCGRRGVSQEKRDSTTLDADSVTAAAPAPTPGAAPVSSPASSPAPKASVAGAEAAPVVRRTGPRLVRLTPSSATMSPGTVILVEISGSGFTPRDNTVHFGTMWFDGTTSPDGRTIRFTVPETMPARGEVPPMMIGAGDYRVYVVNTTGVSDTLTFTLRDR